jgi:hypothetical protein
MRTAERTPGDFAMLGRAAWQLSHNSNSDVNVCQYLLEKICWRLDS